MRACTAECPSFSPFGAAFPSDRCRRRSRSTAAYARRTGDKGCCRRGGPPSNNDRWQCRWWRRRRRRDNQKRRRHALPLGGTRTYTQARARTPRIVVVTFDFSPYTRSAELLFPLVNRSTQKCINFFYTFTPGTYRVSSSSSSSRTLGGGENASRRQNGPNETLLESVQHVFVSSLC